MKIGIVGAGNIVLDFLKASKKVKELLPRLGESYFR